MLGEERPAVGPRDGDMWRLATMLCWVLLSGCSGFGFGGDTDFDPETVPTTRPDWVDRLQEVVEPVPPESRPDNWRPMSPSEWPVDGRAPSTGVPGDLSARIGEPENPSLIEGTPPVSAAAPLSDVGGPGRDVTQSVTVQVGGDGEAVAPAELADPESALEAAYAGRLPQRPDRELKQFGYAFFAQRETDSESQMFAPVALDRPILSGDELLLNLQGGVDGKDEGEVRLQVERDGTIAVAEAGRVSVIGLTLTQAEQRIATAIENTGDRVRVRAQLSFGRLQPIRVSVVGEVEEPGLLEVPGRATVLHALAAAGGPRKSGSLRRIELKRADETVAVVDLYEFLVSGSLESLSLLEPDDVIVVPPIGRTFGVAGAVQRAGIYELTAETTLGEALKLAGGTTEFSFRPHARIERTVDGRLRQGFDVSLDETGFGEAIRGGELIEVGGVDVGRSPFVVEIDGEVLRPGQFEFRPGMTVRDLIELAGGLTVDAYLPQALLSRQMGESEPVTIVPGREAQGTARRVLVIDLEQARQGNPRANVGLAPLDLLTIQSRQQAAARPTVEVLGAVRRPGSYELTAGLTVSQLIALSGNVLPEVYYDEAELIRRVYREERRELDVERYRFDLGRALSDPGGPGDPPLENHDQLVIRKLRSARVRVRIEGAVTFPGEYVFPAGARITDLIAAAGGVLPEADMRAAVFARRSVADLQRSRYEQIKNESKVVFEQAFEQLVYSGFPQEGLGGRLSLRNMREQLDRLDQLQSNGRIVVEFTKADFPRSAHNLTLEDSDSLVVPVRQETVAILGYVFNSGAHVAERGITVADLIARSGGIHEFGDEDRVYVIRADGTVQFLDQDHYELSTTARLFPGDVVVVPKEPIERSFGHQASDLIFMTRRAAEIAYIFSQLGNESPLSFTSVLQSDTAKEVDVLGDTLVEKR